VAHSLCEVFEHPLVRWGVGLIALFWFFVLGAAFVPPIQALAGILPDLWGFRFDPDRFLEFATALGEEGVRLYRLFLYADVGFAVLYGIAFAGWLCHFYRSWKYAIWPLVAAFMDMAENALFLLNLERPEPSLLTLAGYASVFKWIFLIYTGFALLLGFYYRRR